MIYLLFGEDAAKKDLIIVDIKKKHLQPAHAVDFDCDILDGHKLSAEALKKSLVALPAISKQRLIILRAADKLIPQNKKLITDYLDSKDDYVVLVLDFNVSKPRNAFITKISKKAKIHDFSEASGHNVFDVTKAMSSRRPEVALNVLNELMEQGQHPLQLLGGLVWFWGNRARAQVTRPTFLKGLRSLQDADLNIKRSRLKPEVAVEVLVVELTDLMGAR